ncbi:hypothetical protein ACQP1W_26885 [Spirillospora sp. CA-255316]
MPGPLLFLLVLFGSIAGFVGVLFLIGFVITGIGSLFSGGESSTSSGFFGGGSSTNRSDSSRNEHGGCGGYSCGSSCGGGD